MDRVRRQGIFNRKELSAAQPQPNKIRNGILAAKNAKDAKKESGFVGAGLKPALLDLATFRAKSAKDAKVDFDKKSGMGGAFASLACLAREIFLHSFCQTFER
jgi:hypothetical protein